MAAEKKTNKKATKESIKKEIPRAIDEFALPQHFKNLFESEGLGDMHTHTTYSDGEAATLSERDIVDAIGMLSGRPPSPRVPDLDIPQGTWALALVVALLKTFSIRLRETPSNGNLSHGDMIRMDMRMPLGRHAFDQTNSMVIDPHTSRGSRDNRDTLDRRTMVVEKLLHQHLETLYTWVDIAKRVKTDYTVKDILAIKNIEQRMAALRLFGADKLIEETQATRVSKTKRGNELYLIPRSKGFFDEDAYFLKYACVSTGRIYVSGIPNWLFNQQSAVVGHSVRRERDAFAPMFGMMFTTKSPDIEEKYLKQYPKECWADLAMAWKFRLTLEEYNKLTRTNEG